MILDKIVCALVVLLWNVDDKLIGIAPRNRITGCRRRQTRCLGRGEEEECGGGRCCEWQIIWILGRRKRERTKINPHSTTKLVLRGWMAKDDDDSEKGSHS